MGRRVGERPYLLQASPIETIDIDYDEEFELAELVAKGQHEKESNFLRLLAKRLSSPIISDVLHSMGIPGRTTKLEANMETAIFGRAKTLKIMPASSSNKGTIYDALDTYATITTNDVIVVQTGLPELAYFGELNALLAIRCGASGAIINGLTRDGAAVESLQFPVFSRGNYCEDVKTAAAVESYNSDIYINGQLVQYEDLVFADQEGIVVIPKQHEKEVIAKAIKVLGNEQDIALTILSEVPATDLVVRHGQF